MQNINNWRLWIGEKQIHYLIYNYILITTNEQLDIDKIYLCAIRSKILKRKYRIKAF